MTPSDPALAPRREAVTLLLDRAADGDSRASDELLPVVYDELRALARWRMSQERPGHTLQATALVHEAYLRLLGEPRKGAPQWDNRRHFFAAAAEAMRRILIERARRVGRAKHGGDQKRVELDVAERLEGVSGGESALEDLLALDSALDRLAELDEELATIVKLKHFSGFEAAEIAAALDLSERSVHRRWAAARAWLKHQLRAH